MLKSEHTPEGLLFAYDSAGLAEALSHVQDPNNPHAVTVSALASAADMILERARQRYMLPACQLHGLKARCFFKPGAAVDNNGPMERLVVDFNVELGDVVVAGLRRVNAMGEHATAVSFFASKALAEKARQALEDRLSVDMQQL